MLPSVIAKKIKAHNENVLWATDRHEGALVHYVTIYCPPNNTEMAEVTLRHLKWSDVLLNVE